MKRIFLLQLFLILLSYSAQADVTLYVDAVSGNDASNNCQTNGSPCKTIDQAITQANLIPIASGVVNINFSAGAYIIGAITNASLTITRSNVNLFGANAGIQPIKSISSRSDITVESRLQFPNNIPLRSIIIGTGVDNITIDGFELRSATNSATIPYIAFDLNGINSNIFIQNNSLVGSSGFISGSPVARRPLIIKNANGSLTNIQITKNRFIGYTLLSDPTIIEINLASSGLISNNIFGWEEGSNLYFINRGIILGGIQNFSVRDNEFQLLQASAIELKSTSGTGVVIERNLIDRANQGNGTSFIAEPTVAAGLLLRPSDDGTSVSNFVANSVTIRNNEFLGDNGYAIAIPNANNNYTINSISIIENKFGSTNSQADLYVGSDGEGPSIVSGVKINTDANWWGNSTVILSSSTPGTNVDILGGDSPGLGRAAARPDIWLTTNTEATPLFTVGFRPTQIVRFSNVSSEADSAFNSVPLGWTMEFGGTFSNPISITRSFKIKPAAGTVISNSFRLNTTNPDDILTITNSPSPTIATLTFASTGVLDLTQGKIELGVNFIELNNSTITGGSPSSYIITNSTGALKINGFTSAKKFPVGKALGSYTPVTISNLIPATIQVRAINITDPSVVAYTAKNGTAPAASNHAINTVWFIDRLSGTGDATVTFQWPASENQTLFDPTYSYVSHYLSSWENITPTSSVSAVGGLYSKTATVSTFSPFTIADVQAPLPVDLVDFKISLQNSVHLTWITASEKDNDYFLIERSIDGESFSSIAKVKGKDTSTDWNTYQYSDKEALGLQSEKVYYRLKQVDKDGSYSYSQVKNVSLSGQEIISALKVTPNPAYDKVTVIANGKARLEIFTSLGKRVFAQDFVAETEVNVRILPAGVYLFKCITKNGVDSKSIVVQ